MASGFRHVCSSCSTCNQRSAISCRSARKPCGRSIAEGKFPPSRRAPGFHFGVQSVVEGAIKLAGVSSFEHHRQVFAINPVRLLAQLLANPLIEFGSGKRIGNGNAQVVGPRLANHLDGLFDVAPRFPRITELKEKAGPDAVLPQIFAGLCDLLNPHSLLHRIKNLLRTGLYPHPNLDAARPRQRRSGLPLHQVRARLHFEGHGRHRAARHGPPGLAPIGR